MEINNYDKGIACSHPSKLRFEKPIGRIKFSSKLGNFIRPIGFIRDREGIRTPNPQSRNLIFYPVELRSHFVFSECESTINYVMLKAFLQLLKLFFRQHFRLVF